MIKLYSIQETYNTINKIRNKNFETIQVDIIKDINTDNPELLLFSNLDLTEMNYCYISNFEKYYYIISIEQIRKNFYRIKCRIDVLETYKEDILNSKNLDYLNAVDKISITINATGSPENEISYILSTIGGK